VSGKILKKAAVLFCGAAMGALIFSAAFIVLSTGHDCTHDEYCPQCLQLQAAAGLLKQPDSVPIRLSGTAGLSGAAVLLKNFIFSLPPPNSIGLKIRMNT
jgi:hypothetical protein